MSTKFNVGQVINLATVIDVYEKFGIAHIVTDGKYIQFEKEE